jgi:hypothetical protein
MVMRWHSAHIYYYDSDGLDDLILGAVRPLFDSLPRGADRAYFVRHWLRGPHVRAHVRADDATFETEVRPLVETTIRGYLRRRPSADGSASERELRSHERLAELENEAGPLTPWFPDNSIQYLPYDRRLHVLGTEEAADLLADFHTETTPLAFEIIDSARGASRLESVLSLMFATAHIACPPIAKGYLSYRSHAEGFFANCAEPTSMRARFEHIYETNRATLAAHLADVIAVLDGDSDAVPRVSCWAELIRHYHKRAEQLHAAGRLPLPPIMSPREVAKSSPWTAVSEFHQALLANDYVRRELEEAAWFAVYRVLLNYQYLFFSRLGVKPVDRFMLCHLAARTVEDVYGLPVDDVITSLNDPAASWAVTP